MTAKEPTTNANTNEITELAKERTAQAADRTQMAWIRTCLTLIGFGIGIDVLVEGLEHTALGDVPNLLAWSARIIGVGLVVMAVVAAITAMVQYRQVLKMIEAGHFNYKPSFPLVSAVTAVLVLIGLFAGMAIVIVFALPT